MDVTTLLFRWIHIVAAVTAAGGIIFWKFVLMPTASEMAAGDRDKLLEAIRGRWAKLVMLATFALLVTGLFNAIQTIKAYDFGNQPYHIMVLVKLILAIAFFYLAARMSGRSDAAGRFRQSLPFWLNILLAIVIGLVLVGGYMKNMIRVAKPTALQMATPSIEPMHASQTE